MKLAAETDRDANPRGEKVVVWLIGTRLGLQHSGGSETECLPMLKGVSVYVTRREQLAKSAAVWFALLTVFLFSDLKEEGVEHSQGVSA